MESLPVVVALIVSLLLDGCTLTRAHYARPPVDLPQTYLHADQNAKVSLDHWWQRFGDPTLNALVAEALRRNNDLALAVLNVQTAQLQAHLSVINPAVGAGYIYDYSRPLNASVSAAQFHSLTASVSYEVDLWGQLDAIKDIAKWEARATEEDRQSAAFAGA